MNGNLGRGWSVLLLFSLISGFCLAPRAAEINITRTNFTERYITNVIDVHMPMNVFVTEYHTNYFERVLTNVVQRYATNLASRVLTNTVMVNAIQTNLIKTYHTNWSTLFLTNQLAVDSLHTNFVDRYQTNWTTLTLTNWKNVLVMRTNWINQPVTNVVQLDMTPPGATVSGPEQGQARPAPAPTPASAPMAATPASQPAPLPPAPLSNDISLEAYRTGRPVINNSVEVQMKVRWTGPTASSLLVQQWRVESEDGTILVQAQDKDFRRDLPLGRYKVEVRVRREASGPLLAARGSLSVTARDAYVLQKLAIN